MVNAKELLKEQGYSNLKKRLLISSVIIALALLVFLASIWYFIPKECGNQDCFNNAMLNCRKVTWIREDSKAAWYYKIMGSASADECRVKVSLLKMNEGTIDAEGLQGDEMTCTVFKSDSKFPEENIEQCTGILKEQLQGIIIERMHNYLLKNIGEVKQGFGV